MNGKLAKARSGAVGLSVAAHGVVLALLLASAHWMRVKVVAAGRARTLVDGG